MGRVAASGPWSVDSCRSRVPSPHSPPPAPACAVGRDSEGRRCGIQWEVGCHLGLEAKGPEPLPHLYPITWIPRRVACSPEHHHQVRKLRPLGGGGDSCHRAAPGRRRGGEGRPQEPRAR